MNRRDKARASVKGIQSVNKEPDKTIKTQQGKGPQTQTLKSAETYANMDDADKSISQPEVLNSLISIDKFTGRSYLSNIDKSTIIPLMKTKNIDGRTVEVFNMPGEPVTLPSYRWYRIDKIVYEKNVFFTDKFSMLFSALHAEAAQVALVLEKKNGSTKLYIGARDNNDNAFNLSGDTLEAAINGFLTGVHTTVTDDNDVKDLTKQYSTPAVACVSGVASLRDDKKEGFVQGLERLINSTVSIPSYTAFFIADSVSEAERISIVNAFQQVYRQLSPFAEFQTSLSKSETKNITDTITEGITNTIGKTIGRTITNGTTYNTTQTEINGTSTSDGYTLGWNLTHSKGRSYNFTPFGIGSSTTSNGSYSGTNVIYINQLIDAISNDDKKQVAVLAERLKNDKNIKKTSKKAQSYVHDICDCIARERFSDALNLLKKLKTELVSNTENGSIQHTETIISQLSNAVSKGDTHQIADLTQQLVQDAKTKQTAQAKSMGSSESKTLQITTKDLHVKDLMETIEAQIKRLRNAAPFGLWNCATYFVSNSESTSRKIANIYKGTIVGEESGLEVATLNSWDESNPINQEVVKYLNYGINPRFFVDGQNVSAGTTVSSKELAIHMALPQSSVPGIVVQTRASFGRNVAKYSSLQSKEEDLSTDTIELKEPSIKLGSVVHLGEVDKKNSVSININDLSRHTFVTGTTGSGKSNTMYLILDSLYKSGKKFMVIEPKKGEYKKVLGGLKDVVVLGTNPYESKLLTINPFSFNYKRGVMVYEHVDRLVEIFNACWPMYAAMPAVLKKSILDAYKNCGWNTKRSEPRDKNNVLFPTIDDVVMALQNYIDNSEYSSDSKSDYKGAIETRLMGLTEGSTGLMLNSGHEILDNELFDENVIIDLSRVGNSETVSLIMGIIILKLNEYRTYCCDMNEDLSHVTVIEEAHNILKRTSTIQNQESSNLIGKSVEMISECMASMRTYGEGFIIVDQSPAQVDMSTIRLTNTKIILSLPEQDDCNTVGKSICLTDEQIAEISRQKVGQAIIYQNDWEEPVQCVVDKYNNINCYRKTVDNEILDAAEVNDILLNVIKFLIAGRLNYGPRFSLNSVVEELSHSKLPATIKFSLFNSIKEYNETGTCKIWKDENFKDLSRFISLLVNKDDEVNVKMHHWNLESPQELTNSILELLVEDFSCLSKGEICIVVQCLLRHQSTKSLDRLKIYDKWKNYKS